MFYTFIKKKFGFETRFNKPAVRLLSYFRNTTDKETVLNKLNVL